MNHIASINNVSIIGIEDIKLPFAELEHDGYLLPVHMGKQDFTATLRLSKIEYYKFHLAIYGSLPKLPRKLKKRVKK